ncbi:ABC transporter permease [Fervidobacterium thailandense]|uniref:ABC transporter permease n=1 Tax=Fervidobacterium thailandense TaxID=1008305 RepID=A0A1E3G0V2_9BACT|nr:ABC transporter permease [Fervidobacterium thailandense]
MTLGQRAGSAKGKGLKRTGSRLLPVFLVFTFFLTFLVNLSLGTVNFTPAKIVRSLVEGGADSYLIWSIRFPRVVMATLTGMALGLVGNVFQSIMKNPLVDPYLIGTSAGASFGALLGIYFIVNSIAFVSIPLMSFIFSIVASMLTILIARKGTIIPVVHLVLSGVLVSTLFSAGSMLLLNIANRTLVGGHIWLYGTFSGMTMRDIPLPLASLVTLFISALALSRQLDAMSLGEREAKGLGVNTEFIKWYFYLLGSFTTATFVSKTGIIGFVGLVVPHMARMIVGPKHFRNVWATILIGGTLLPVCDTIARTVLNPVEIPVGIITAFIGAPFMFVLLKVKNGS